MAADSGTHRDHNAVVRVDRLGHRAGHDLTDALQLESLVEHARNAGHYDTEAEWQQVAKIIQARWEKEKNSRRHELLDGILRSIHQETGAEARLAYLRLRVKLADDESRPDRQRQLFDELIGREWSAENEAETLALLDR